MKVQGLRRGAAAMIALVLVARLMLPCLPSQALADPDGADFFIICTANGVIDLRKLDPELAAVLAGGEESDREAPAPADGDPYRVCSGFCALTLSLPSTEAAYPSSALALRNQVATRHADFPLPSSILRHSLAARAPPLFQS